MKNELDGIYSVSFMVTADDNGGCLSFELKSQRDDAAKWMRSEGYYQVTEWSL